MLTKLQVTNFKVIRDSSLISLKPLTVFIGRNGSGKSSIIEALDWLGCAVYAGAQSASEQFRRTSDVIHGWHANAEEFFGVRLVFDPEDISASGEVGYEVEVGTTSTGQQPVIRHEHLKVSTSTSPEELIKTSGAVRVWRPAVLGGAPQAIQYRERKDGQLQQVIRKSSSAQDNIWVPTSDLNRLVLSEFNPTSNTAGLQLKQFLERAVFLRLNPRTIASFAPDHTHPSPRLLDEEGAGLAALLSQLGEETLEILIEKLSFIIQGAQHLETHQPLSPADRRYFTFYESSDLGTGVIPIPAWVLSEGTRRITAILAILLHDNPPPFLCIEEVENGLDPWTIKYLLNELAGAVARGTQIILTSHSPYLLNFLPLESIVLCERNGSEVTFQDATTLEGLEDIQQRMGTGDLYANRYLVSADNKTEV